MLPRLEQNSPEHIAIIRETQRAAAARKKAGEGFMYVIEIIGTDAVKIGFSLDPAARANRFGTRCRLLGFFPCSYAAERQFHRLHKGKAHPDFEGHEVYPRSILSHPAIPAELRTSHFSPASPHPAHPSVDIQHPSTDAGCRHDRTEACREVPYEPVITGNVMGAQQRVVVQFSCGAASACAWMLAVERYGDAVVAVNAFIADEDDDNRRFLEECERWIGQRVTVLRDVKDGASPISVWRRRRFIINRNGSPCSKALKRDVLNAFNRPNDLIVLGFTADPRDAARLDRFIDANAGIRVWAPLIEAGLTKDDCFRMITRAGIELPRMYRLGYPNANCPMCPKGGEGYWNHIRVDFPDNFEEVASIQDVLGPGSYFFRNRKTGERISLRMLDPDAGRFEPIVLPECGAVCEVPDDLFGWARAVEAEGLAAGAEQGFGGNPSKEQP